MIYTELWIYIRSAALFLSIKAGLQSLKRQLADAQTTIGRPNENEHKASKEAGANFRRIAEVRSTKQSVFNR